MRKTKYKSREPIFEKGWSGRGVSVIDEMETFKLPNEHRNHEIISTRDKLGILLKKYRSNRFYRSLHSYVQRGYKLSRKQVHAIEDDFKIKINGVEVKTEKPATMDTEPK